MTNADSKPVKEQKPKEPDDSYFEDDENEFIPCSECDGHPACEDFGCAIEHGLKHLVKKEPSSDDL